MLDIKYIREHPEVVKEALKNRGVDTVLIDKVLKADEERRVKIKEVDDLRAEQNRLSEEIIKVEGEKREKFIEESKNVKSRLKEEEEALKSQKASFVRLQYQIPNIPLEGVPIGEDERYNEPLREKGEKAKFSFKPRDYMEIAIKLDLIDIERAAKVSGSRFGYLKNEAVRLEFALVQFAFNTLQKYNFIPVVPPVMIQSEMMRGMGYIDSGKDEEERYFLERDTLFLVGTSEQSIVPMHANETLTEAKLPYRYTGFSTCFRREAGSYGRDTYGILRVHQFDKMEMVIFAKPEDSRKEHELMIRMEEELMQELNIPYRVVALCTGDISQPSAKTIDIESWFPGQKKGEGEYRETHSSSNTTDYQARRLNIKFRDKHGRLEFVHILNGTVFAIGRMLIAILENYQQEDGSVVIPEVLQKYMGGIKIIKR